MINGDIHVQKQLVKLDFRFYQQIFYLILNTITFDLNHPITYIPCHIRRI